MAGVVRAVLHESKEAIFRKFLLFSDFERKIKTAVRDFCNHPTSFQNFSVYINLLKLGTQMMLKLAKKWREN